MLRVVVTIAAMMMTLFHFSFMMIVLIPSYCTLCLLFCPEARSASKIAAADAEKTE